MRKAGLAIVFLAFTSGNAVQADVTDRKTNQKIFELAFDPDRNFRGDTEPFLTILYRGDDWGVPVYSLGIAEVEKKFIARMVRATKTAESDRPRAAGYRLYAKIDEARAKSDAQLKSLFDAGAVEWLEADVESCVGSAIAIEAVHSAQWSAYPDMAWNRKFDDPENGAPIVIHADTVRVQYRSYLQQIEYSGWFTDQDDHVSTAVLNLAKILEPCWKPAASNAPWHRRQPRD
jgi:hypothetical protein